MPGLLLSVSPYPDRLAKEWNMNTIVDDDLLARDPLFARYSYSSLFYVAAIRIPYLILFGSIEINNRVS